MRTASRVCALWRASRVTSQLLLQRYAFSHQACISILRTQKAHVRLYISHANQRAVIQSWLSVCVVECLMSIVLFMQGKSAADIGKWIREHAGTIADVPQFAKFLAMQLFPGDARPISCEYIFHDTIRTFTARALAGPACHAVGKAHNCYVAYAGPQQACV